MILFDVIRDLNTQINIQMNDGLPGKRTPVVIGATDGTNVTVTFMDNVIWDSSTWEYGDYPASMLLEEAEKRELALITSHLKNTITEYLTRLYNIQW